MIGVTDEQELQQNQSAVDVQGVLGLHVGRILRVQNLTKNEDGYSYGGSGYSRFIHLDEIGELEALKLERNQRYQGHISKKIPPRYRSTLLYLKLKGLSEAVIDLDSSMIEVLQVDSGSWKTIHRSEKWIELFAEFESMEKK